MSQRSNVDVSGVGHGLSELNALGQGVVAALWFLNNVRVRTVGIAISGLMVFMLVVGVASGIWSYNKVGNIATHWHSFDVGASSKRTLMDQIRAKLGYGGLLFQVKEIVAGHGDPAAAVSVAKESIGKLRSLITAYRSAGVSSAEETAMVHLTEVIAAYEAALDGVAAGASPQAIAALLAVRDEPAIEVLATLAQSIRQDSEDSARAVDAAVTSLTASSVGSLVINGLLLLLLAGFFQWFTRWRIVQPLDGLGHVMERLTKGDKSVVVPFQDKRDELGDMARAVQIFKENAIRLDRMAEEKTMSERAAEEAKRRDIQALADRFEREIKGVVEAVTGAASELQRLAQDMNGMVDGVAASTGEVASASARVSDDVSSAAAAAEELSASIQEILRQVGESSTAAGQAVTEATRARAVMGDLSTASGRIDDIVKLIEGLAQRIDLLALNATIEAMRAGEFGKGFAVVAGEVKGLATQTAKATSGISEQIAAIQKVSGDAVQSIGQVCAVIERIDHIARQVSTAVGQQSQATAEITKGVDRTASETRLVSERMGEVTAISRETGGAAKKVLAAAHRLGEDASRLSSQVAGFVAHVRAG